MTELEQKADQAEQLLKDEGPMTAREIQYKIRGLSWIDALRILGEDNRFTRDDSKRYHLTDEAE